jgi:putative glycosyltransferase (TIGR04348 family)
MATIAIAAPVRPSANSGNDVTAARWAHHLNALGHETTIVPVSENFFERADHAAVELGHADLLIALHARRSAAAASWWKEHRPGRPLIVGLAGTDLYKDMPDSVIASATISMSDALIVLQADAVERLRGFEPAWAEKAAVIHQSVSHALPPRERALGEFRVVVLAHLRDIKDPLLAARAARRLGLGSHVVVHHAGRAHDDHWQRAAESEERRNDRYIWHRELNPHDALALLASAHVLACTSLSEGGANVVTEAIALGIPVIGTRIGGNTGLLGSDHPGWVPVGDDAALAELLTDLERDPPALAQLEQRSIQRQSITDPSTERAALKQLVTRVLSG